MKSLAVQRVGFAVLLLIVWDLASGTIVSEFFISTPGEVGQKLWALLLSGALLFHTWITLVEAVVGFVVGAIAGIGLGLVLGRAPHLSDVLDPFIMGFYSLPKVALAPLFVLWFGIGLEMKIILVGVIVFFLVFLNTFTGARNVSREQVTILRLLGASERDIMIKVVAPSAITWVFAGLRLSVPYALIGAIIGEIIASNRGLGFLLSDAASQFDTGGVFAALVACLALGMALNALVRWGEKSLMPWRAVEGAREFAV